MKVAFHQPYYFPWPGYLHKMLSVDKFIIMDDVQFSRGEHFNRTEIMVHGKKKWLSIPVSADFPALLSNVMLSDIDWVHKHEKKIKQSYAKAKYAADAMVLFNSYVPVFLKAQKLLHVTIPTSIVTAQMIGIETEIIHASDLGYEPGLKSRRILNMCKAVGADTYVAGSGGSRNYLDVPLLNDNGIEIEWQTFKCVSYRQCGTERFVPGLSTLDLVANLGRKKALEYIKDCGKLEPATLEVEECDDNGSPIVI